MSVPSLSDVRIPLLGFAAPSGTGKTTLLRALIPKLKAKGLRIAVVKHAHHAFEVDQPGKDSFELRKAGALPLLITSSQRRVIFFDHAVSQEPSLAEELTYLETRPLDLILVEGFKTEKFAKIELHRPALGVPPRYLEDPQVIALATDVCPEPRPAIPVLDLGDAAQIAGWIFSEFLPGARRALGL